MSVLRDLTLLAESRLVAETWEVRDILRFLERNWIELRAELVDRGRQHLLNYQNNPDYSISYFTGTDLKFHTAENYEMAVSMVEPRKVSPFLSTLASDIILLNIGDQDVLVEAYKLPDGWSHEVFDPKVILASCEQYRLAPGATLPLSSGTHVPRILPPAVDTALLFKIAGTKLRNLVWNFSPESLQAQFTAASWVTGQRLKVAAKVLGSVEGKWNREKVIPALRRILANENHDVRWAALESLCWLDAELGTELLRDATADPHPHIAATAKRTLDRLAIARN